MPGFCRVQAAPSNAITHLIQKMKQTKMAYVSPSVEAMSCKVEQGFQCSGEYCDGAMLENITESSHNPDASFN